MQSSSFGVEIREEVSFIENAAKEDFQQFVNALQNRSITNMFTSDELILLRCNLPKIFSNEFFNSNVRTLPHYEEELIICNEEWFETLDGFITVLLFEVFNKYLTEKYLPRLVEALKIKFKESAFEFINSIIEFIGSHNFINVYRLPRLVKGDIESEAYKASTQQLIVKWSEMESSQKEERKQLKEHIELLMQIELLEQWEERKKDITKILNSLQNRQEEEKTSGFSEEVTESQPTFNLRRFCERLYNKSIPLSLGHCKELRSYLPSIFSNLSQLANLDLYQLNIKSSKNRLGKKWFFTFNGLLMTLFYHVLTIEDINFYWPKIIESIEYRYREVDKDGSFILRYLSDLLFFIKEEYQNHRLNRCIEKRVAWVEKAEVIKELITQLASETASVTTPLFQQETIEENTEENLTLQLLTPPLLVLDVASSSKEAPLEQTPQDIVELTTLSSPRSFFNSSFSLQAEELKNSLMQEIEGSSLESTSTSKHPSSLRKGSGDAMQAKLSMEILNKLRAKSATNNNSKRPRREKENTPPNNAQISIHTAAQPIRSSTVPSVCMHPGFFNSMQPYLEAVECVNVLGVKRKLSKGDKV